jgi:hypothetical protein
MQQNHVYTIKLKLFLEFFTIHPIINSYLIITLLFVQIKIYLGANKILKNNLNGPVA